MKISKSIILSIMLLMASFICQAQDEPETVRGKDLLEKIDRSEIEANDIGDSIELDTAIPIIEFEKIEFEKPKENKSTVKNPVVKKSVEEKPVTTAAKDDENSKEEESDSLNKITVLMSNRRMSNSNLLVNDIISVEDGITYIYRKVKSNTIQYKFSGVIPFDSEGLNKLGEDRYIVVDLELLKSDPKTSLVAKKPDIKQPVVTKNEVKNETVKATTKADDKVAEPTKVETKPVKPSVLSKSDKIKKDFENQENHGNKITDTITLEELLKNDIIHVSGDVQLVVRKNRNTYEMEYYWLVEDLELNTKSLIGTSFRALSNNRFKVTDDEYKPTK